MWKGCCFFILVFCLVGCGREAQSPKAQETMETAGQSKGGNGIGDLEDPDGGSSSGERRGSGEGDSTGNRKNPEDGSSSGEGRGSGTGNDPGDPEGSGEGNDSGDPKGSGEGNDPGNRKDPDGENRSGGTAAGGLSVAGTQLVDSAGNPVQLRGISTHGLAWFPDYVNADCIRQLKEEWGMNVFRLAMYTAESGGYCTGGSRDDLKALVRDGVKYATDCGMYVIIDWHILSDGNPNTYIDEAKAFFEEMSREYADYTNVIYEICNEPNGGTSWSDVKAYAEQVIAVIRENDADGIILVGTPNWSQYVEQAAADPITDYSNIMYTLHFYAATHTDSLRASMVNAIESGLPVFVSEYGICDASGSGAIDENQAEQWVRLMDEYQISYVAWNLSNKSETSAVIKSSCCKVSGFGEEDLSESGKWLYKMLQAAGRAGELTGDGQTGNGGGDGTAGTGTALGGSSSTGAGTAPGGSGTAGAEETGGGSGQTGSPGGNQNEEGSTGREESGQTESPGALQEDALQIGIEKVNSWTQGDESYYQYRLTLTNSADGDRNGWTIHLSFNGSIELSDSWNGRYQAEGSILTISSMDYNAFIGKGGSVGDIGFIVKGGESLAIEGQ
ncbi:MAG: cellulase family glycosylhydrolase [Lachnospiraceae bacterium]|nr:cellulase family glycosylhydrolase [Lachnospiraceae bacterium]